MKVSEMKNKIEEILEDLKQDYNCVGLRFENKEYEVGDECECSRNNIDREDERDFPDYGSDEYEEMEIMDGTSSWELPNGTLPKWMSRKLDNDCIKEFGCKHAYLIVGNKTGWEQLNGLIDDGEILINDAIVAVKLY